MDIKRLFSPKPAAIIILAVSFGVYCNVLFNGFVYDDEYLLVQNPLMRDARHIPEIFLSDIWAFKFEGEGNYYRPMFHLFYMADYHIFGLRPWGFHLTKILLHMGSSLFVFLMASTLINCYGGGNTGTKTYKEYIPFAAALLFATHPINSESIAVGTTEVLFAFFYFLSFYLYIRADVSSRGVPLSSVVFFFFAALSKETALTLPILLFAYDYSFKRDSILHPKSETLYFLFKRYLPYIIVAGIYFILRTYAIGGIAPVKAHAELSGYEYFINVFPLFAQYLGKLILPINLNAAYIFHPIHSLLGWKGILSVTVTAGFIATLYLLRNRNKIAFFSLLLIVIPLLPVFYIPALGSHTFAERYMYLPSVGFVIVLSMGLCNLGGLDIFGLRKATFLVLPAALIITALYSTGTIKRNPVWKDDLTLWSDTAKKSPDSHGVHNNLGDAYYKQGRLDEAMEEFRIALKLKPDYEKAHNNLGLVYTEQGRIDEAIEEYKEAIKLNPASAGVHNNLGSTYYEQGRIDEAIEEYREALRLKPDFPDVHNNLGLAYAAKGRIDEAIEEYKEALRLNPDLAQTRYNLGNIYSNKGRIDEAIEEYKEALRLKPDYADAHNNLGLVYAKQGRIDEAIEEYKSALAIRPDFPKAHNNLGNIYYNQGHIDGAIAEFQIALRLEPDYVTARYNLGLAYKRKGLKTEAIREFEEVLKIRPDFEQARRMLQSLSR
jgi:tetratricopeptide (TPR) repeat protein